MSGTTGRPVRVVCLDLGGVVVRICRSWEEGCAAAGVEVREPERFRRLELGERRHRLTDAYMSGDIACDEFFGAVAAATDGLYTPDEVRRVHVAWVLDEYEGVAELVASINATPGFRTACLSNTNHAHWTLLTDDPARYPTIAALGDRLVSHEMRAVKPDEAIFRLAEGALGAAPDEILFLDDLGANVEAARAAGWRAEAIDHDRPTAPQIAGALERHGAAPALRP